MPEVVISQLTGMGSRKRQGRRLKATATMLPQAIYL